ncbi:MAG: hypothetical protein WA865_07680 [Spirulinaceae cyanobacterium]
MQYIDTRKAAAMLKITPRRVVYLLQQRRFKGAYKIGKVWAIPLFKGKPKISRGTRGPAPRWCQPRVGPVKIIHVNGGAISRNKKKTKLEELEAVISVKHNQANHYGHEVDIYGPCRLTYSYDKAKYGGARLWIETYAEVEVFNFKREDDSTVEITKLE